MTGGPQDVLTWAAEALTPAKQDGVTVARPTQLARAALAESAGQRHPPLYSNRRELVFFTDDAF